MTFGWKHFVSSARWLTETSIECNMVIYLLEGEMCCLQTSRTSHLKSDSFATTDQLCTTKFSRLTLDGH